MWRDFFRHIINFYLSSARAELIIESIPDKSDDGIITPQSIRLKRSDTAIAEIAVCSIARSAYFPAVLAHFSKLSFIFIPHISDCIVYSIYRAYKLYSIYRALSTNRAEIIIIYEG